MENYVSSNDIARAAGVSRRSVQQFLREHRPSEGWHRIPAWEMPAIVKQIEDSRKRRRKNVFNREAAQ